MMVYCLMTVDPQLQRRRTCEPSRSKKLVPRPVSWRARGRSLLEAAGAVHDHPDVKVGLDKVVTALCDLGQGRIDQMDAAGIDLQVLSLTAPGVEQLDAPEAVVLAREVNDAITEAVTRFPTRFAGFATLPTASPSAAVRELERCVGDLGFKGVLINGHTRGAYLDESRFWPILECAEAVGVPIYLHPTFPTQSMITSTYAGNYAPQVAGALGSAAWGWHIDTALHVIRLALSGAFDHFPGLQLVIGHRGEGLPFMLPRLDQALARELTGLDHTIGEYLRQNVHYTFSGFNWTSAFLDLMLQVGSDRIMFAADYPYASMVQARQFLDQLPVSPADRERIAHGNAESLLNLCVA